MKWRGKNLFRIVVFFAAIALILSFAPPVRVGTKTIGVAINLLIPEGRWRPLEWLTRDPLTETQTIESQSGRRLTIHLYQPAHIKNPKSALILYTPFVGQGPDDPRLQNLMRTFARGGFLVAFPWREEDPGIVSVKDISDVVSTALFLLEDSDLEVEKLGFMGLSYGNGPVIAAANDPKIKDRVPFVISFAGYYDLQNAATFIQTGEFAYGDIKGMLEPDPYAREIFQKTLASYNIPQENILESTIFKEVRKALSPSFYVDELSQEFFILHSTDDRLIPYTESMRLADALRSRLPVTFGLTSIFEHGEYKPLTLENMRRAYLPTTFQFYTFLYRILKTHL